MLSCNAHSSLVVEVIRLTLEMAELGLKEGKWLAQSLPAGKGIAGRAQLCIQVFLSLKLSLFCSMASQEFFLLLTSNYITVQFSQKA